MGGSPSTPPPASVPASAAGGGVCPVPHEKREQLAAAAGAPNKSTTAGVCPVPHDKQQDFLKKTVAPSAHPTEPADEPDRPISPMMRANFGNLTTGLGELVE